MGKRTGNQRFSVNVPILILVLILAVTLVCGCKSTTVETTRSEETTKTDYPNKEITLIVPQAEGSSQDILVRGLAPYLQKYLGKPVIVNNVDGASGRVALAQMHSQIKPDGYTLCSFQTPTSIMGELLFEGRYKVLDFNFIGSYLNSSRVIIAGKDAPFNNYRELVEMSKDKVYLHAMQGLGSTSHLQAALMKQVGDLPEQQYVMFQGAGEIVAAVIGGHCDYGTCSDSGAYTAYSNGDIKVLAIHSDERTEMYPDVPTLNEQGYEGMEILYTQGIIAPPGLPDDVKAIIEDALVKAVNDDGFREWARKGGHLILLRNSEEYTEFIKQTYTQMDEIKDIMKTEIDVGV